MHVYLRDYFVYMIVSFICGIALSVIYDIIRIFRLLRGNVYYSFFAKSRFYSSLNVFFFYEKKRKKNKNEKLEWVIFFFEDLIYSFLVCLVIVVSAYCFNFGMVRFFSILSLLIGYILWRIAFGRFFMRVFEHIVYILRVILFYVFYPFIFLIEKIKKVIYKSLLLLYNNIRNKKALKTVSKDKNKRSKITMNSIYMEKK